MQPLVLERHVTRNHDSVESVGLAPLSLRLGVMVQGLGVQHVDAQPTLICQVGQQALVATGGLHGKNASARQRLQPFFQASR
ncbi:hypothetical protein D3C77_732230 [compost metagenome]